MSDDDQPERVSQATAEALAAMGEAARRLGEKPVEGVSADRRVMVRVTAAGQLTGLRLREDALRRYDPSALADLITRTVRQAQDRARTAYDAEVAELIPPEVATSEQELRRIWRD